MAGWEDGRKVAWSAGEKELQEVVAVFSVKQYDRLADRMTWLAVSIESMGCAQSAPRISSVQDVDGYLGLF